MQGGGRLAARLGTTALLILLAGLCYAQPVPRAWSQTCSFDHPPMWPSFCFQALDRDGLAHLGDPAITPPVDGVMVLGWLGTQMPGPQPIRVWVYTRPDKSIVSSRLLHGDALARLYTEVEAWLAAQPVEPVAPDVPRLRVSR